MVFLFITLIYIQFVLLESASQAFVPMFQSNSKEKQIVVSLPEGFKPPIPPMKPLLYPFVSSKMSSSNINTNEDTDWYPIIPTPTYATTVTAVNQYTHTKRHHNHRYDAIDYNTKQQTNVNSNTSVDNELEMTKNYILIGGQHTTQNVNEINTRNGTINLKIIKENETLTRVLPVTQEYRELHTTVTPVEDVWPRDLLQRSYTTHNTVDIEADDASYEYENTLSTVPVNITKMGVPFEHYNSSDAGSICVPLTIQLNSSSENLKEVEKVYCFPLSTMKNNTKMNQTSMNNEHTIRYIANNSSTLSRTIYINYYTLLILLLKFLPR